MNGPSVRSNTKWQCEKCRSIFDFPTTLHADVCPNCGHNHFAQLVIVQSCDFCSMSSSERWWRFPCEDFIHDVEIVPGQKDGSRGDWCACDTCKDLILRNDRQGLAERANEIEFERYPEMRSQSASLLDLTLKLHEGFFRHRTGPVREDTGDE